MLRNRILKLISFIRLNEGGLLAANSDGRWITARRSRHIYHTFKCIDKSSCLLEYGAAEYYSAVPGV